jgi:hypothetical protein
LRSAVADTAANLFGFVPSLGTREAVAFGVGVPVPTRLTFAELPPHLIPRSEAFGERPLATQSRDLDFIVAVLERWRGAMARTTNLDEAAKPAIRPEAVPLQPAAAPDASRLGLLKKPLATEPFVRGPASPAR